MIPADVHTQLKTASRKIRAWRSLERPGSFYPLIQGMQLIDISGQTFGRLTVLRKSGTPSMWECRCSCGTTRLFTGSNLRRGNTTSCGCAHREKLARSNSLLKAHSELWLADMLLYKRKVGYRANRLPRGKVGSNQFTTLVRGEADPSDVRHPSLTWALDLTAYTQLVTGNCFYCGKEPEQVPQGVWMKGTGLKRNGIDRVDNGLGYEEDNCVSCCTACNREKRHQSQRDFIANTRRRYEHLKARGLI